MNIKHILYNNTLWHKCNPTPSQLLHARVLSVNGIVSNSFTICCTILSLETSQLSPLKHLPQCPSKLLFLLQSGNSTQISRGPDLQTTVIQALKIPVEQLISKLLVTKTSDCSLLQINSFTPTMPINTTLVYTSLGTCLCL